MAYGDQTSIWVATTDCSINNWVSYCFMLTAQKPWKMKTYLFIYLFKQLVSRHNVNRTKIHTEESQARKKNRRLSFEQTPTLVSKLTQMNAFVFFQMNAFVFFLLIYLFSCRLLELSE